MNESKGQSLILTGIALLGLALVLFYYSTTLPETRILTYQQATTNFVETATTSNQNTTYKKKNSNNSVSRIDSNGISYSYPINLNNCTMEELMSIKGIGESKASAILEYRDYIGGYTSVDEIKNIKGIGDKTFNEISPYLCV